MDIRDQVCVKAFITDMRDELCDGTYFNEKLTNSELEELIMLFFDIVEMDTDYNCEEENDQSLFLHTYTYDNFKEKKKVVVNKKICFSGRAFEKVKDILSVIYRYYTGTQLDAYVDLDTIASSGIEAFFKKVIHVKEKKNYTDNLKTYGGLSDGSYDFTFSYVYDYVTSLEGLTYDIREKRKALKRGVLKTRNDLSHGRENFSVTKIPVKLHEVCIALLIATYDNRATLKTILDEYKKSYLWGDREKTAYLQKIIDQYKSSDIYDSQRDKERYVEMRVSPSNQPITSVTLNKEYYEQNAPHCIMLHGTAGTGKTTIINHFEYQEALACLQGLSQTLSKYQPVPVKLQLGNLTKGSNVITNAIGKKLQVTDEQLEKLLNNGELHIYLDAVDEYLTVNNDITIKSDIANFINTYSKCFIYVTGRKPENFPTKESCNAIRCQLGKMNEEEKDSLIRAYAPEAAVADKIVELRTRSNYDVLFENPLFIKMMVRIVSSGQDIPKDDTDLITSYLTDLFRREVEKTHDDSVGVDIMFLLLSSIHPKQLHNKSEAAYTSLAPLPILEVRLKFKELAEKYGLAQNFDSQSMILKFIDLNILEKKNDFILTYSTMEYQSYFEYAEYYLFNN